ncbi:bacterial low temperature requirement A protein-domain-containing protein [Pyrenochaeta sp. MPI-SDFR-AT-0127]|nr:bacterial low temperature requirement A protein-domain-containing protein [Pyrenochaeta sp. MPI-SDFR-AT-0127]
MGFSFHGHKRDVDAEKHLKRLHKTTPWIESPLAGADHDSLVFSQRHEANSVELFFDLFFVANLATFTAYHSITDGDYLLGYIGFFGILWSCWFQITLHDVRFARDSLYERVCKTIQFIVFVGLALVGSQFNPASHKVVRNNTIFEILCYTLVVSRSLLMIQYLVVLYYTWRARYSKIYLPLLLMVGIYAIGTAAFAGMTPAFRGQSQSNRLIYLVWYAVMVLEAIAVVTISCFWRMLSFKKTHLMERMSLLTIIVIGEGAIGVTKTVGRIMGKHGLDVEGCFLIMCIIVILVFLWALYFDNFPHGHYGTIRQQIWSLLHFPFQLSIVGVVEGAQQLALARYVNKNAEKVTKSLIQYCRTENLDGTKLQDKLTELLEYFELDQKLDTMTWFEAAEEAVDKIGKTAGICSAENVKKYTGVDTWPQEFVTFSSSISNGVYTGLGMKLPLDKLEKYSPFEVARKAWTLVYMYFWACFCMLIICSIVFLFLIRRHKVDLFDFTSVIIRFLVLGVGGAMMALLANHQRLVDALRSPALLPICVVLLFLILVTDKASALWCNWRLKKSGQQYALEYEEHGHHEHHADGHGAVHETHTSLHGHASHESLSNLEDIQKQARWSAHPESLPLAATATGYESPGAMSPNPETHQHVSAPAGYMPVSGGQHQGV